MGIVVCKQEPERQDTGSDNGRQGQTTFLQPELMLHFMLKISALILTIRSNPRRFNLKHHNQYPGGIKCKTQAT